MDKKTLLIAQILMTCMMAFSMSGIMLLINLGPFPDFIWTWAMNFAVAWPIAFLFTQIVSRIAFPLAAILRARLG